MLNETESAASFHGLCHFFGRLSKASRAGMIKNHIIISKLQIY